MPLLGLRTTQRGNVSGLGVDNPDIRVSTYGPLPTNGWIQEYGAWLGKRGGSTQTILIGSYVANTDRVPVALQGYCSFSVSPDLSLILGAGADFYGAPTFSVYGLNANGIPLLAGQYIGIFAYNLDQGAISSASGNETVIARDGLVAVPDPFGTSYTSDAIGVLHAYINYKTNEPPQPPAITPAGGAVIADITPTFTTLFVDADTPYGDRMSQYHIQVRRISNKNIVWNQVLVPSDAEKASNLASVVYAGAPLTDTAYEYRVRVADYHNAWSDWRGWRDFTIASGPKMLAATAPVGKQEVQTPGPFQALYTHTDGRSYDRVRISIYNSIKGIISTLRNYSELVMGGGANTVISVPWQSGWYSLDWGKEYSVLFQARDNQGKWSPLSDPGSFFINAPSATPSNLSPNTTVAKGSRPLLTAKATDTDDTVATGLGLRYRIKGRTPLTNGTFDANINGWTTVSSDAGMAVVNSFDATEGAAALGALKSVVTATGAAIGAHAHVALSDNIPIVPGEPFRATFQRKTLNPTIATPKASVFWYKADGVTPSSVTSHTVESYALGYVVPTNVWEARGFTVNAPSDAFFARVSYSVEAVVANGSTSVWHDDFDTDASNARFTRLATLRVGTLDTWDYQVTATDAPGFAIYKYDAQSFDGSYTSPWSAEARFSYQAVPVVTITTPTDGATVATPQVRVEWASDNAQVSRRVYVTLSNTEDRIYDSGLVNTANLFLDIPVGYLRHNVSYDIYVESTSNLGLTGTSNKVSITVLFTQPPQVSNVFTSPVALAGDTEATALLVNWDASGLATEDFVEYIVYRQALSGPPEERERKILRRITSIGQNSFLDLFPASGLSYRYGVSQVQIVGVDPVDSLSKEADGQITLTHVVISAAAFGSEVRASLRYVSDNSVDHLSDTEMFFTWGDDKPTAYVGSANYHSFDATFRIIDDRYSTAEASMDALRELDDARTVSCYRDERGRKFFFFMELSESDQRLGRYEVNIKGTETSFTEGED